MSDDNQTFDTQRFRNALANFATGVTVVTTRNPDDNEPVGVTVSSFNSLSLEPPMVLWSLYNGSYSLDAFKQADYFIVNVLAEDQIALSQHFSKGSDKKFETVSYHEGIESIPKIDECVSYFECRKVYIKEGGDHTIFLGEVVKYEFNDRPALIFHKGNYAVTQPHPESVPE